MAVTLFSYERGTSVLHRMNALFKIAFLTVFCILIFWNPNLQGLSKRIFFAAQTALCVLLPALLFLLSHLSARILLRLWPVLLTGAFVTAFRAFDAESLCFSPSGFFSGCIYALNFFMASLASCVVFKTTQPLKIRESLEGAENACAKIIPPVKKLHLALALSLTFTFIPSIFEYWEKTRLACMARSGTKKRSIRILCAHFSALLSCLLYRAETTRKAVLNRSEEA